jgi:hypothetical protein
METKYHPGDLVDYYIPKYDKWFRGTYVSSKLEHDLKTGWTTQKELVTMSSRNRELYGRYHMVQTRKGAIMPFHQDKVKLIYSFEQELTELLETGNIKKKENNKMAKFTTIGMIAKKKDGSGSYIKIDVDVNLKKGQYLTLSKKPTEEQVEANPKLKKRADKWPQWKSADIVLITDS